MKLLFIRYDLFLHVRAWWSMFSALKSQLQNLRTEPQEQLIILCFIEVLSMGINVRLFWETEGLPKTF